MPFNSDSGIGHLLGKRAFMQKGSSAIPESRKFAIPFFWLFCSRVSSSSVSLPSASEVDVVSLARFCEEIFFKNKISFRDKKNTCCNSRASKSTSSAALDIPALDI